MSGQVKSFLLVFSLCVVVTSCPTRSCIQCPPNPVNCTITELSDYEYNYYCEAPFPCRSQPEHGSPCFAFIHKQNGQFIYSADQWNNHPSGTCTNYPLKCDVSMQFDTLDDFVKKLERDVVTCSCHGDDCQAAMNITIFVTSLFYTSATQPELSSSSSSSLISLSEPSIIISSSSFLLSSLDNTFYTIDTQISTTHNIMTTSSTINNVIPTMTSLVTSSIDITDMYSYLPTISPTALPTQVSTVTIALLGVIAVLGLILIVVVVLLIVSLFCYCQRHSNKGRRHSHQIHFHTRPPQLEVTPLNEPSPLPFQLIQNIGNGKFGSVWKALYNDQTVAVKIFSPHHKISWQNERDIHVIDSTPHENILHYILGGSRGSGYNAQYYIITQYYPLGSLNYFLRHNSLSWEQAWNVMYTVSSGLAHLHSTNYASKDFILEKSSIAHRDIKSSNILVKNESGQCVLGDLGLAFILDPTADDRKLAISGQVGTYRYMAPEALDARVNLNDIESFKQIDVYALALVLWEVCMRCKYDESPVQPYQSPYFDLVGEKPTLEQMKEVVVSSKQRPPISGKWYSNHNMRVIANFLTESWDEDPEARLTAANVIVQLENLVQTRTNTLVEQTESSVSVSLLGGQVSENSQSSLFKKVPISASFSCSSSATQSFVSRPVRISVDHIPITNIDLTTTTIQRNDTHPNSIIPNEESSSVTPPINIPVNIDATTGQQQTSPTDNQCTIITDSIITHDHND